MDAKSWIQEIRAAGKLMAAGDLAGAARERAASLKRPRASMAPMLSPRSRQRGRLYWPACAICMQRVAIFFRCRSRGK